MYIRATQWAQVPPFHTEEKYIKENSTVFVSSVKEMTPHHHYNMYTMASRCFLSPLSLPSFSLRFFLPLVENVQLSLVLQTENKGSVVAGGELNVCLDGMVVDLGSLPNGSTAPDSESRLYHTHAHTHTHT